MKTSSQCAWALSLALCSAAIGQAQSFAPGNLAVLRVGDGSQTLANTGNSVFIDQYTPAGALSNSIALPDSATNALLVSGSASSEGGLTRSLDRTQLVIAGYNTNRGSLSTSLASSTGATVPRAVGTVDAFGAFTLAQASTTVYSANNIRCATGDGSNSFWTACANIGTCYFNPPHLPVTNQTSIDNTRYIKAINGTLCFSTQAKTPGPGIYCFQGAGLPKAAVATNLLFATGSSGQTTAFDINPALTVAYVADQRTSAGGIQKWTNNAGVWSLVNTFTTGAGAFGVAVDFSGSAPIVYATTGESSANRLIRIVDTNSSAVVTTLATAANNCWFRGIDFAPDLRPVISSQPQSQVVTNGADASFSVSASSVYPLFYQWQKNGANLDGATNSVLTLRAVTTDDQAVYQVVVSNQYSAILSSQAALTVNVVLVAPGVVSEPQSQTVDIGGTVTFSVSASGTAPLHYQWRLNSADLSGETNASLTLSCVSAAAQGSYAVTITNAAGTANSQAASLVVLAPAASYVAYTNAGAVYAQDFNSLPNTGTTSVNADNPVSIAAAAYGLANPFDFAFPVIGCGSQGGLGASNTLAGWYGAGDLTAKFGASAGDQSTGGIISFGSTNSLDAATNRALGLLATSSTGGAAFGVRFVNETTNTLTRLTLSFTGELWRQSAAAKTLAFSYWIDPDATSGFATNVTAALTNLDVIFPVNPSATTPIPMDGTDSANQLSLGVTGQTITNWPPGAALWLVWRMADSTSKGQGLAIDNLAFSASATLPIVPAKLSIQLSGASVVLSWPEAATGCALEVNSDLGTGGWSASDAPVVVTNGSNTISVPVKSDGQYFRLKCQ